MHVPKTGGAAVCKTAEVTGRDFRCGDNQEHCFAYTHQSDPNVLNAVIFRDPRAHAMSQYMHCRMNPYSCPTLNDHTAHPFPRDEDVATGFSKWISHFAYEGYIRESGAFNCFNPINIQARYLTCAVRGEADKALMPQSGEQKWDDFFFQTAHYIGSNDRIIPNLTLSLERLESMQVVMVTEALPESYCLLIYKAEGSLPSGCACDSPQPSPLVSETHGLPSQSLDILDQETLRKLDKVTWVDKMLHKRAIHNFFNDLRDMEVEAGVLVMCTERRMALREYLM